MYLPSNFEDPDRHDSISAEVKNGRLIFDEDTGEISPNADFPRWRIPGTPLWN